MKGPTTHPLASQSLNPHQQLDVAATRVIFPSGTIDPWHALGVTNSTPLANPLEGPCYILGTAHCADMHAPAASDPPSLTWARESIAAAVARWVKIGHHKQTVAKAVESVLGTAEDAEPKGGAVFAASSAPPTLLLVLGSLCLGALVGAAVSMLAVGRRRLREGMSHLPVAGGQLAAPLLDI